MFSPKRGNIYMLMLFAFMIVSLFTQVFLMLLTNNGVSYPAFMFLNQVIFFLVPFLIYCLVTPVSPKEIISLRPLDLKNAGMVFVMCLTVQPLMNFISYISSSVFGNFTSDAMTEIIVNYPTWTIFFTIAVVPAVLEEITFRGVIYKNYEKAGLPALLIVNGIFFGIMHGNFHQFSYAFLLGSLFAYFVYRTGSILSSMLGHFVINASSALLMMYSLSNEAYYEEIVAETDISLVPYLIYMAVSTAIFLLVFKKFQAYNLEKCQPVLALNEDLDVDMLPYEDIHREKKIPGGDALGEPWETPRERMQGVHDLMEYKKEKAQESRRFDVPTFIIALSLYVLYTIVFSYLLR